MNATSQLQSRRLEERVCEMMRLFSVPSRGPLEAKLHQLKEKLLQPVLNQASDLRLTQELTWAANEAAALAWYTDYPLLVFPGLLEEKLSAARRRWLRQQVLWQAAA